MRILIVISALCCFGTSALAQGTPPDSWQGSMTITALTGAPCAQIEGLSVGSIAIAIYRPKLRPSDQASSVNFVWNRAAAIYQRSNAGQLNGQGQYNGTQIVTRASLFSFSGDFNLDTVPAVVRGTTQNVTMVGTLTNFQRRVGCTATIRASFTKRPDSGQ